MNHLFISREYPPAPYLGGGIGTYVNHMSRLLAEHGETVHVIAQMCPAAPHVKETGIDGRLTVHRVPIDRPLSETREDGRSQQAILGGFRDSVMPSQAFLWQAALLAESLIERANIDVIEAQEYEAPLYFLMLRRALRLGSSRRVPMVVHLHSPSEFVFRENGLQDQPEYGLLTSLEAYTILGADAWLCPSRFLADAATAHYRLERDVSVIPYPLGPADRISRSDETWRNGSISYVGRLEPRKGVQEWIEAASSVAADDTSLRFSFVGADTTYGGKTDRSMRALLRSNIRADLQSCFAFSEAIPNHRLATHRARARLAVVPSRWENFPYSCVEAMASGLPVLVSPNGGMAEMIEDGRTGWIAAGSDSRSLEAALRRALSTGPADVARMGGAAAESIGRLCDSSKIVRQHLDFKRSVVARGCLPPREMPSPPAALPDSNARQSSRPKTSGIQTGTMTPMEIIRAPRAQQAAVLRRALTNPAYVIRWLVWHVRRTATVARELPHE